MCKELLIAFLYFLTIVVLNFFLLFLFKSNLSKIFYFQKFKTIENKILYSKINLIPFLYFYNKYEEKIKQLKKKNSLTKPNTDSVIIGNIYKELRKQKNYENFSFLFYYKLQEAIYLSKKLEI
jgi:hypothetical protein